MTTILINPWSKSQVIINNDEALDRLDDALKTYASNDEIYHSEGLSGVKAIEALIEKLGIDRMSDIWFS